MDTSRWEKLNQLQKTIDETIKAMSDEEVFEAFWLEYESEQGYLERAIDLEYHRRRLDYKGG